MSPAERTVRVVAAVVRREGRYLLGRRPEQKRHGGLWMFPGGKVRDGESRLEAVRRELSEELGLHVMGLGALLHSAKDPGSPFVIDFVETLAEGEPVAHEHTEVRWLAAGDLVGVPLAPADASFAASLGGSSG